MPARPEPSSPVTLKTIADEMGLSVTAVGRALKDGRKVSAETVRKVRETADRLGYVRNLDGVKLRTGKSFVAMAFLSFAAEEEIGDSGSVGLLNGIHHRLAGSDYAVRAVPVAMGDLALDKLAEVVKGRNADGIILDHTEPQDARVRYLLEQDMPFVTFGRTELFSEHAYFDIDNEFAAHQGTASLIAAGKRRIALIDGDRRYMFVRQRRRGYETALREAGLAVDEALIRHITVDADLARTAAAELAGAGADGFVCVNELAFLGARAGARAALGENFGSVGFSMRAGTNLADYIGTPAHSCYYSRFEAGWNLADLLLKRIAGEPVSRCQRIVRTQLRVNGKQRA